MPSHPEEHMRDIFDIICDSISGSEIVSADCSSSAAFGCLLSVSIHSSGANSFY